MNMSSGDYQLSSSSPYRLAASDGKDIGADMNAVRVATATVLSGQTVAPPPPPPTTVAVTISSTPSGQQVSVDGAAVTTPATFQWAAGSQHTVSAVSSPPQNGTRLTFANWSDGGAQTHAFTVPSGGTTLVATYATAYLVSATSNSASWGSVTASPATSDSFYAGGSTVQLSANPSPQFCFTSWSGISATGLQTSIQVNSPITAVGNFQAGVFSVSGSDTIRLSRTNRTAQVSVGAGANCRWAATSQSSWISVTPSSQLGPGTATIQVTGGSGNRTGTVVIAGRTITVHVTK